IRLFHNEARWTLESGKRKRVDTSLAWTAPKQVGGGVLAGSDTAESTAAAGRHTEKEAADTRATAARVGSADEAKPDPVAAESRADSPAPAPPPPQRPKTRSRGSADKRDVLRKLESNDGFGDFEGGGGLGITGGSGRGGGGDGTIGTGIGGSIGTGGTGGGYGTGSGGAKRKPSAPSLSGGAPSVSGNLDAGAIRRVIQAHMNRLRYCHARALETQPGLAGKILVKFTITAKGTATNVKTSADPALEKEVAPCVVATIEKMKFSAPPGGKPVEISYPLVFKAE
ncbi:MAG TPA: AgmX/PglI C-terminal domain-containing protein, partial [Kofleriaceae bacterium]|nr:AgmX/PglI C-terminal domain-containing protein [Kofleriaceae bacterium]